MGRHPGRFVRSIIRQILGGSPDPVTQHTHDAPAVLELNLQPRSRLRRSKYKPEARTVSKANRRTDMSLPHRDITPAEASQMRRFHYRIHPESVTELERGLGHPVRGRKKVGR